DAAVARKGECVHLAGRVNDGQFQVTVERRGRDGLPIHLVTMYREIDLYERAAMKPGQRAAMQRLTRDAATSTPHWLSDRAHKLITIKAVAAQARFLGRRRVSQH